MSPDSLRRLLADLPEAEPAHPIDAGLLGEYAFARRQHGQSLVGELYPRVEAHLRTECQSCQERLDALRALVRREELPVSPTRVVEHDDGAQASPPPTPEPLEIAEAITLGRAIEAERDALRAPLRPDRSGQIDVRRQSTRRRQILMVEAALVQQRLLARRLFLDRASGLLAGPPHPPTRCAARISTSSTSSPARRGGDERALQATPLPARRGGPGAGWGGPGRQPNPKARLLLDDFAGGVTDLARLASRIGRLAADVRRIGDDPRGPARSQSEALTNRGLSLTREALAVDHRLARLQGLLAGMVA